MPPALPDVEVEYLSSSPEPQPPTRQALVPVINRSPAPKSPWKARTYGDDPLPIRLSTQAPRKAQNPRIIGRVAEHGVVTYTVMVGDTEISGIELHEIDTYVSPHELEEYENQQFREEGELMKIAEAEAKAERERQLERQKERSRRRGIIVAVDSGEESSEDETEETAAGRHGRARPTYKHLFKIPGQRRRRRRRDSVTGELLPLSDEEEVFAAGPSVEMPSRERSRQNPSSSAPTELPKRRRRRRDPATGELMPLSGGDGEEDDLLRSSAQPSRERSSSRPTFTATGALEPPKRRRRKRDPRTGELLPLSPEPQSAFVAKGSPVVQRPSLTKATSSTDDFLQLPAKRPRRRRHPQTGELMPLGWRYDPEAEAQAFKPQANGIGGGAASFLQRLSIGSERETKRVKLTSEPSSGSNQSALQSAALSIKQEVRLSPKKEVRPVQVIDLDSDEGDLDLAQKTQANQQTSTRIEPFSARKGMLRRRSTSSSEEQITLASFLSGGGKKQQSSSDDSDSSAPRRQAKAAISPQKRFPQNSTPRGSTNMSRMPTQGNGTGQSGSQNPTPQKNSITNPIASQGNDGIDESDDEEVEEGEFIVQKIVAHKLSDPRTHPGKKVTMLYETKWEGFDETTWEPVDSFEDDSVVMEYRRRVGLSTKPQQLHKGIMPRQQAPNAIKPESPVKNVLQSPEIATASKSKIEFISSDEGDGHEVEAILGHGMSDPSTHPGKEATMLYKVKWVGFKETSWEPYHSFVDKRLVKQYQKRVGLR